jgi:ADP-ribosyl-[dinitrogen reductase] hydrolase
MLLELAVGDAYGAAFEYADPAFVREHNDGKAYCNHPTERLQAGRYTDDTQMSLAIAEALISGEEWTPLNLAKRFVQCFRRDPRQGYAGKFYQFLCEVRTGEEFLARMVPSSEKSGAAMRAAPIGILPTVEAVKEYCTIQARLTHDTPNGIAAAAASSLMTHYFLYKHGAKADLGKFLEEQVPEHAWATPWTGKVLSAGWMSVRAAVTAVMGGDSMTDILRACIAFTGDVDTVATIALAAASCSPEVRQDLSDNLTLLYLENGTYGQEYIRQLDERLWKRKDALQVMMG